MARVCGEEAWGVTSASGWGEGAKCRFGAKFSDVASHEQAPRVPTRLAQGGRTGSGGRCVGTTLEVRRRFLWRMFARSASRSDASTGRERRYNKPPVQGCELTRLLSDRGSFTAIPATWQNFFVSFYISTLCTEKQVVCESGWGERRPVLDGHIIASSSHQSRNIGAMTRVMVASILMRTWMEGPAVSLKGSPTVSPVTAAL